ncbi:hypothetical protein Celaphus_00008655 [Cervus elaphus hippelaphus]|uniref:Swi5-dependent recombination DNA repair protein 1 homolog n=1 Tax=Cervus elaphus hippelaphus TaxID=46360 RepID=A0A212CNE4_CEREH|nr:hypothetical protein Celaphus_00008655 [Cervus elaphus hippelaphus]
MLCLARRQTEEEGGIVQGQRRRTKLDDKEERSLACYGNCKHMIQEGLCIGCVLRNGTSSNWKEVKQDFKMESPSNSALMLPSTPQAGANPPSPHSSSSRKQPMSATLRERLRKTRSSFNSCYSVVKRLKVESEENDQTFSEKSAPSTEESCLEFHESFKHTDSEFEESTYLKDTFKSINNDLSQLQLLIEKWRSCSQQLLYELQSAMSEENKKLSLTQLIDHYGLDDKLLHYNRNEEEFIGHYKCKQIQSRWIGERRKGLMALSAEKITKDH